METNQWIARVSNSNANRGHAQNRNGLNAPGINGREGWGLQWLRSHRRSSLWELLTNLCHAYGVDPTSDFFRRSKKTDFIWQFWVGIFFFFHFHCGFLNIGNQFKYSRILFRPKSHMYRYGRTDMPVFNLWWEMRLRAWGQAKNSERWWTQNMLFIVNFCKDTFKQQNIHLSTF